MTLARVSASAAGLPGRVIRRIKDGYWDRTEVIEMPDSSRRVRKSSQGEAPPGPWGIEALRREIDYLSNLPESARGVLPALLAAWDDTSVVPPQVGYEMPFYADHTDVGDLARRRALEQAEIDAFQDALADALFHRIHAPVAAVPEVLSRHIMIVVEQALETLAGDADVARVIDAATICLNGDSQPGLRAAFANVVAAGDVLASLDSAPQVRLHGDCFLENILWRPAARNATSDAPQLVLVDPVSVAGIAAGPPLFDLVKYESYATGELPALRNGWVDVAGFPEAVDCTYRIRWSDAALAPFREHDWHTRVRRAFEAAYGPVDRRAYRLIDGYFSVAMAVNTKGVQRRARLLKAAADFAAAVAPTG